MIDVSALIWIAGIFAFLAACIWLLIRTAFQLERKDRRRGRRDLDEGGSIFGPDEGPL
jgi:hypothetical protein